MEKITLVTTQARTQVTTATTVVVAVPLSMTESKDQDPSDSPVEGRERVLKNEKGLTSVVDASPFCGGYWVRSKALAFINKSKKIYFLLYCAHLVVTLTMSK